VKKTIFIFLFIFCFSTATVSASDSCRWGMCQAEPSGGVAGSYIPDADDTYDLGSPTYEFRDIYIDGTGYFDQLDVQEIFNSEGDVWINDNLQISGTGSDALFYAEAGDSLGLSANGDTQINFKILSDESEAQVLNGNLGTTGMAFGVYGDSSTPADTDQPAILNFKGNDHLGNETIYAQIYVEADDVTDGTEDGTLYMRLMTGGALAAPVAIVGGGSGDDVAVDGGDVTDPDFVSTGDIDFVDTANSISANLNDDVIGTAEMSDADFGDWTCSGGSCTLDADVVAPAEIADADFGDFSCASGVCTMDIADDDDPEAGDVTWSDLTDEGTHTDGLYCTYSSGTGFISCNSSAGAETNSLETTITGIADTEIFVGNGANSGTFVVLSGDATLSNAGALSLANDVVAPDEIADADFGDYSCSSGVCTLDADTVAPAEIADSDFGDLTCASGVCTLDADTVGTAEIADADFGDITCSGGVCTFDADTVAPAEIADADFGDFTCSGGVCTLDGGASVGDDVSVDGGATTDPDFVSSGDVDFVNTANTITANLNDDVVGTAEMADADFGDWTCSSGSCTLDADTVAPAEIADADFGEFSCSGGVCSLDNASASTDGAVELATAAETTTGTDATRAVTPDGLAGSDYGVRVVTIEIFDDSEDVTTGDGAGDTLYRIPDVINGYNLVDVEAYVQTAGTTGTTDVQIYNVTQTADMLTTKITIDSGETDSATAAAAPVIDTANDDVATADKIRIDVDATATTEAKGLWVELQFQKP
jgi:hypothetical protein